LILTGKLIKGTRIMKESSIEKNDAEGSFRDLLEESFIALCRELDTPVPMWLKKNSTEFARYRRTFFNSDQFVENIKFDRLEIKLTV